MLVASAGHGFHTGQIFEAGAGSFVAVEPLLPSLPPLTHRPRQRMVAVAPPVGILCHTLDHTHKQHLVGDGFGLDISIDPELQKELVSTGLSLLGNPGSSEAVTLSAVFWRTLQF